MLTDGAEYDYVTRTSLNQGILRQTGFVNEENINPAGVWSVGLLQMDFFYRKRAWYAGQFVKQVIPKVELSDRAVRFFTVLFNKLKPILLRVLVRNVDKIFLNLTIKLPTREGEVDFAFMEEFIAELEAQRVAELEAYLTATGLRDCHLTAGERAALAATNIQWGGYKIGDLFKKIKTQKLPYKAGDLPKEATGIYTLPALTAGSARQGLNNYVPRAGATILRDVISLSANGNPVCFYQSRDFTVLQDAYAIQWTRDLWQPSSLCQLFFVCAITKTISGKFDWNNKSGWERVKDEEIFLPVREGEVDFAFMEEFIRAVEKEVIRGVVEFADRQIAATHAVLAR